MSQEALVNEQTERHEKRAELELIIKDLTEDVSKEKTGRNNAEDELNKLKAEIAEKQETLEEITPQYQVSF